MDDGALGVYVHVPFCQRVCPYCDFAVVAVRRLAREREAAYVAALLDELALRARAYGRRPLASLYLGGGTPSLLQPESIGHLVEAVTHAFPVRGPTEVTLEMNPGTTERERLPAFREAGVNRLSIGVQSFDDAVLKRLGRAHRAQEGRLALRAARDAGFENVSLDLVFGVPGGSQAQLGRDLDEAVAFGPEHVSAYELTIEAGTPFERGVRRGQLVLPDEDEGVRLFELVEEKLEAAGLARYEISSFARSGRTSVHNRRYWERLPVLGIGMGAWSIDPPDGAARFGARRANVRDLDAYLAHTARGQPPDAGPRERLSESTARGEAVFLALRTARGLDAGGFAAEFGSRPRAFFARQIDELAAGGLLEEGGEGDLRLTRLGRLVSDSVFERFVSAPSLCR